MKKIKSMLLILTAVFCLSSCGKKAEEKPQNFAAVTDQSGFEVVIEEEPQRIVSGYYISTSALIALDETENLVGIEAKAETRNIYALAAPSLIDLPNVGSAKNFDLEGCAALEPDLVVLPLKLSDAAQSLRELGIDVILVNPESHELLCEMIDILGKATGNESRSAAIIDWYGQKLDEIEEKTKNIEEKPTVYMAGNSSYLSCASDEMYQGSLIEKAGGINAAQGLLGSERLEVSYEQFLAFDPDYIIIPPEADYTAEDIYNDENLSHLSAVSNGGIYTMPTSFEAWDSPVPSGILGTVWLSCVINEEAFSENYFSDCAVDFYSEFYNFTPNTEYLKIQ